MCAALAAAACGGERSSPASARAADTTSGVPPRPPAALSRFDVPLAYDFSAQLKTIERVIPQSFGSMDSLHPIGDNDRKMYAFAATRGPFVVYARGSEVFIRTVFSYAARGFYKPPLGPTLSAGCGKNDERPSLVIELVAPLTLSSDWHLRSASRLVHVAPASDSVSDRCRVSILQLDVTDRVLEAARAAIAARLPELDKKIATVDLTAKATGWWNTLNRPIRLAEDVWLTLNPVQIRLGKVHGDRRTLTVEAGLDAFPAIVTGNAPPANTTPLPPLGKDTISNGFSVVVDGRLNYAALTNAFGRELAGKTIETSGRHVALQSASASYDGNGRIALTVNFTGDARGMLRLVGTPQFDVAREYVMMPDLNFDLTTDSDVLNTFTWLKSDALLLMFRNKVRAPVAPALEHGKELVAKGINRTINGVVTLSGSVDSVAALGLYATAHGVFVRASVTGNGQVAVRAKR